MESTEEKGTWGVFMHPLITGSTENGDPWKRNYYAPPVLKPLVPRRYPLHDLRSLVDEVSATDMLRSHGFGIVSHHSALLNHVHESLAQDAIAKIYHEEIRNLVKSITGATEVFIVNSVFRQGKGDPTEFQFPKGRKDIAEATASQFGKSEELKAPHKLASQTDLQLAAPVRVPHMDFTPLGARQTIRSQDIKITQVASDRGIIAVEDEICRTAGVDPATKASDEIVAQNYNARSGNRYAAFSIWRPLKTVHRDPIALSPRKDSRPNLGEDCVHWFYENRIPGPTELNGDYLKEYAMLGVKTETLPVNRGAESGHGPKWYFLSQQTPEEVLFIKLFDSASLGSDAEHASAPWHGSPEIGGSAEPRESIDIRVVAFW